MGTLHPCSTIVCKTSRQFLITKRMNIRIKHRLQLSFPSCNCPFGDSGDAEYSLERHVPHLETLQRIGMHYPCATWKRITPDFRSNWIFRHVSSKSLIINSYYRYVLFRIEIGPCSIEIEARFRLPW